MNRQGTEWQQIAGMKTLPYQ